MTTSLASMTVTGTVTQGCCKPFGTIHGPRIRVKVQLESEEVTLWGNPGDADLEPLRRGVGVRLLPKPGRNGATYYKFVGLTGGELAVVPKPALQPVPAPPQVVLPLPVDDVERGLQVYEQCLQGAIAMCARHLPEGEPITDHARQVATTIYISVSNRR